MEKTTMTAEVKEAIEKAQEVAQGMENAEKAESMNKPETAEKPEKAEKPKKSKAEKTADRAEEKRKAEEQKLAVRKQAVLEKEFKKRVDIINKNLASIETSFLVIAFNLHWIKRNGMHKTAGYKNIYEYAESEYGLGKTTCSNLVCIIDNYAKRDADGNILEEIDDCYKRFKQSQLVAMSGMAPEQIEQIDEKTSVREILRMRKAAEIDGETDSNGDGENDGDGESGDSGDGGKSGKSGKKAVVEMKHELLTQFSNFNDYMQKLEDTEARIQKAIKKHNGNVIIQLVCVTAEE